MYLVGTAHAGADGHSMNVDVFTPQKPDGAVLVVRGQYAISASQKGLCQNQDIRIIRHQQNGLFASISVHTHRLGGPPGLW